MSKRLDEIIGTVEYDGLIAGDTPVADVKTVTIRKAASAVTLKRGTVLALSESGTAADGKMVILGTSAASNEVLSANCILCDDAEVGTSADVTALAYRTGHFAANKLYVKDSYTMKDADKLALHKNGIVIDNAIEY